MGYPATGNPVTELLINGTWTAVSTSVRAEAGLPGITITRGRPNEQSRVTAQRANLSLNNRNGAYSNRNPLSAYFGLLPRNTQMRITAGSGDAHLRLPMDYGTTITDRASTPDAASLDVVGDMEVRADVRPATWRPSKFMILGGKWANTGEQRSWVLYLAPNGVLKLSWSKLGTDASRVTVSSTVVVPASSSRLCVKATLDVDNGAAGNTVAFYTASSIDGTYTQLGASVVTAGVTAIFSSSAKLTVGQGDDSAGIFSDGMAFRGKFYKFRFYSGIAGTIVANPDFTTQTIRATSFADSVPKTWTIGGNARITSDRLRFWGETSSLPQRWDITGSDVWVPVQASGQIRRLSQGASPLSSPLYRALSLLSTTGYIPLEDGTDATSAASAVTGARAATTTNMTFAAETTLPGSKQAATFTTQAGNFQFSPKYSATTGTAYFTFYFRLAALPASTSILATLYTTGKAKKITISVTATTFTFDFYDGAGTNLSTLNVNFGTGMTPTNQWLAMNILLETSGSNTNWSARWSNVAAASFVGVGPTAFTGTVGRITDVRISAGASANFVGAAIAHVHTSTSDLNFVGNALALAAKGYLGEAAGTRAVRLATEEGITLEVTGDPALTEAMGYQTSATFMDLLYECADADMGILGEARDALALTYRTRIDLQHRLNTTLTYTSFHLSEVPEPTEDDQSVVNDVTVTRTGASSGRREITTGSMSTAAPPSGIGRYKTDVTLNAYLDSRLPELASWLANRGAWDEARYPSLAVGLHRSPFTASTSLSEQMWAVDLGDTIALTALPAWLPPDAVSLLAQGCTERLGKKTWDISFNTTPAGPYSTGRYDYTTDTGTSRYTHASSTTLSTMTTNSTSLLSSANSTAPVTVDKWTTTSGSWPFNVMVAGEEMTVTAVANTYYSDTFTRTVANGWGTADTGQTYATSGGSASDYFTIGTLGRMNMSTTVTTREVRLLTSGGATLTLLPDEIYIDSLKVALVTGAGAVTTQSVTCCRPVTGSSNEQISLNFSSGTSGNMTAWLSQRYGGAETVFDSAFPAVGAVNQQYSVRIRITPTVAYARVWLTGSTEPPAWTSQITLTNTPSAGDFTISTARSAASTNVAPFNCEVDGVSFPNSQTLTVTRAVNGVSKTHVAGERIKLYTPVNYQL